MLQITLVYLVLSGLFGAALTYYYDDDTNYKLQNILKWGLMLLGGLLVYFSTSQQEASLALVLILVASVPLGLIKQKR